MAHPETKIVEVINTPGYEKYHYLCLTAMTARKHKKRTRYLNHAAPKGLRRDVIFIDGDSVGMSEYAPAEASAYPIKGPNLWTLNCLWVLQRASGHGYGQTLMERIKQAAIEADGLATIALQCHHTPWLRLAHVERLGFQSIDSRKMRHKAKHTDICFRTHLMWMPLRPDAQLPEIDWKKMLQGVDYCIAHPLYRATSLSLWEPFEPC